MMLNGLFGNATGLKGSIWQNSDIILVGLAQVAYDLQRSVDLIERARRLLQRLNRVAGCSVLVPSAVD